MGVRLGLVRNHSNTIRLGLAIGLCIWVIAVGLALLNGRDIFVLGLLGAHVRLLLAIPLMFAAETLLDPRQNEFMQVVVRSRVVPGASTTAADFVARMGIGFEGGNLDHGARFTEAFEAAGDPRAAAIQAQICEEEVAHTAFALSRPRQAARDHLAIAATARLLVGTAIATTTGQGLRRQAGASVAGVLVPRASDSTPTTTLLSSLNPANWSFCWMKWKQK
jgi:hypothetical protein